MNSGKFNDKWEIAKKIIGFIVLFFLIRFFIDAMDSIKWGIVFAFGAWGGFRVWLMGELGQDGKPHYYPGYNSCYGFFSTFGYWNFVVVYPI